MYSEPPNTSRDIPICSIQYTMVRIMLKTGVAMPPVGYIPIYTHLTTDIVHTTTVGITTPVHRVCGLIPNSPPSLIYTSPQTLQGFGKKKSRPAACPKLLATDKLIISVRCCMLHNSSVRHVPYAYVRIQASIVHVTFDHPTRPRYG